MVAKSYARIGWQNLVNFGIVPLEFADPADYAELEAGDIVSCRDLRGSLEEGRDITLVNETRRREIAVIHRMSERQIQVHLAGGVIGYFRIKAHQGQAALG